MADEHVQPTDMGIGGCEMWTLPAYRDPRGSLVPIEFTNDLPFTPARTFFISDVPRNEVRGKHAHRKCAQFLIAVHGALSVDVDDGTQSTEVRLDHPAVGLYIPSGVWGVQHEFQMDAVLVVLASHPYDANDYIHEYDEFLRFVHTRPRVDAPVERPLADAVDSSDAIL